MFDGLGLRLTEIINVARKQQMAAAWSRSGIIKGVGIPAPSGPHTVGCVDVMHLFEGDTDGLLVKLFYPTSAGPDGPYPYSEWLSHKRYVRGMLDYVKAPAVGLLSTLVDAFLSEEHDIHVTRNTYTIMIIRP